MSCVYYFNDKIFKNVYELDDEILRLMSITDNIHDLVFYKKYSELSEHNNSVILAAQKTAEELSTKNKSKLSLQHQDVAEWTQQGLLGLEENIPEPDNYSDYLAVTQFMKSMYFRGEDGKQHPAFPLFKLDEYWVRMSERLQHLSDKDSWVDKETGKVYITQELVDALFGTNNAEAVDIPADQLLKYQIRLENYWRSQALLGDLSHELMAKGLNYIFKDGYKTVDTRALAKVLDIENIFNKYKLKNNDHNIFPETSSKTEFLSSVLTSIIDLSKQIQYKYKNPRIYTELKVSGQLTGTFLGKSVLGMIDLLVIDDNAQVGIYDFKCSPKPYGQFNEAKKRTFKYQLAIYRRLIKQLDIINQGQISVNIIPIQFKNYSYKDELDNLSIDDIKNQEKILRKSGYATITGIYLDQINSKNIIKELDAEMSPEIEENLNLFLEEPILIQNDDQVQQQVNTFIQKIAPEWYDFRDVNNNETLDEKVVKFIDRNGGIKKSENDDGGFYFYYKKINKIYTGNTKEEILNQIKDFWKKSRGRAQKSAEYIQQSLFDAKKFKKSFQYSSPFGSVADPDKGTYDYVEKTLQKYADSNWTIITYSNPGVSKQIINILKAHGILLLKNNTTNLIDVIKCSSSAVDTPVLLGPRNNRRNYIMGTFLSDDQQIGDLNVPPLEAIEGNLELMETLAILNYIPKTIQNIGGAIGEIKVINSDGKKSIGGLDAPSDQLVKNFRKLFALSGLKDCHITMLNEKGGVKLSSHVDLVHRYLQEIKSKSDEGAFIRKIPDEIITIADAIDSSIINELNQEKILLQMENLLHVLEEKYPNLKGKPITEIDQHHPERLIYNEVLLAIAELQKVQLTQQTREHPNYFDDLTKTFKKGIHGLNIDNPGMLESQNLNNLTYLTERAYQNVRSQTSQFNQKLRKAIQRLKDEKSSLLGRYTIGNQTAIYQNLFDKNAKKHGNLQLVPLESNFLTHAEREFLTFAVKKFVYDRGTIVDITVVNPDGTFNEQAFNKAYDKYKDEVLQVPLARASFGSTVVASGGLLKGLKSLLKQWLPNNIKDYLQGKYYELLDTTVDNAGESQKSKVLSGEIFEMVNRVKNSYNTELRERLLTNIDSESGKLTYKTDLYEQNLEKLLLYSQFSLSMEKEINKIFPSLKAIVLSLSLQGTVQNDKFTKDVEYAINYIKNKIQGLPLEDVEKYGAAQLIISETMQTMSKLALAFNPLQLYQIIDGLWKDILLIIQKPDVDLPEDSAFTKQHMSESFLWIIQDVVHFGDEISMGEAINDLYGLNDRDINVYIDRINSDTSGIFNFWSLGFRFASRPDYYNRMTIFGAQMRKDGSFKAHHIENGQLVYNWKEDERFKIYAQGKKEHSEYNKQKALYLAMAKEFILEGAKNPDGTLFVLGTDDNPSDLPRAYTTKQSESMKSIADKIYGYYSHEKKSMMQSFTIGALFMQMHTYWSAKKNQYLAGHGFSQEGQFVQYKSTDPDGNIQEWWSDENGLPTQTNTGVPYMVWEGKPYEGILVTIGKLLRDVVTGELDDTGNVLTKDGKELRGWSYMLSKNFSEHTDAKLRRLNRANITRLMYDTIMMLTLGMIVSPAMMNAVKKYIKNHENRTLLQATINTTLFGMAKMFKSSTDDFFAWKSLTGQIVNWDPFSISMAKRVFKLTENMFSNDKDSIDSLIKFASATRNTEPLWDYVKFTTTGRFIGESKEK